MIRWTRDPEVAMGVADRAFVVERDGDKIPGCFWTPAEVTGHVPLVLIGHGGGSEKRNENGLALARRIVRRHGFAAAAIDAVGHGERGEIADSSSADGAYADLWKDGTIFDRMVADWKAVLDALITLPEVDGERVGYWGLSMGTMLGVPFVASERRIKAAALGLAGFTGSSAVRGRFTERHKQDAPRISCPLAFFVQWDDERFGRDGAFELFDTLGSTDKRLHAYPGLHAEMSAEARDLSREFLAERL